MHNNQVNVVSRAVSVDGAGYQLSQSCLHSTIDATHVGSIAVSLLLPPQFSSWVNTQSVAKVSLVLLSTSFQFPQLGLAGRMSEGYSPLTIID